MRSDMLRVASDVRKRPRKGKKPHQKDGMRVHPSEYDTDDNGGSFTHHGSGEYYRRCVAMRFNVIRNFLTSRVGKLWNDVYSEICERADSRSAQGRAFRKDVRWMVDDNTHIADGFIYHSVFRYASDFYVDPETGILHLSSSKRLRNNKYVDPESWKHRKLTEMFELQWENGIWYSYRYEMRLVRTFIYDRKTSVPIGTKDVLTRCLARKKQLSKRELQQHRVRNNPVQTKFSRTELRQFKVAS